MEIGFALAENEPVVRSKQRENKEEAMIRIYEQPVLPKFCKILFIGMIVLTAAMLLVDLNAFFRYDRSLGIFHLLKNLAVTGLICWWFCGIFLCFFSLIGMKLNQNAFYRKKRAGGIEIDPKDEEAIRRNRAAIRKLNVSYTLYLKVSGIGALVFGAYFALVQLI